MIAAALPERLRLAREDRAHGLRASVRLRGRVPRRRRRAERARPLLDHGRDGRRAVARDGPQPVDRRRHRRAQSAHRDSRAARRAADAAGRWGSFAPASLGIFLVAVCQLDPLVRWLWPIPVVGFVIYPYLKRFTWLCHLWLGAVDGLAPVGAWVAIKRRAALAGLGARRGRRVLGRGLRPLLLALRRRVRPARRVSTRGRRGSGSAARSSARACSTRLTVARSSLPGSASTSASSTGSASPRWRRSSSTSTPCPAGRPAPPRHRVLHDERRHQRRVLRVRPGRLALTDTSGVRRRTRPVGTGLLEQRCCESRASDHEPRPCPVSDAGHGGWGHAPARGG